MSDRYSEDEDLRDALGALRATRERNAGDFREAVASGRVRVLARRSRRRRRTVLALAAAVPVSAGLAVQLRAELRERADLALAQEAARIAAWQSPTHGLLTAPYADLMREIPSLNSSVLDSPIQPRGGSR